VSASVDEERYCPLCDARMFEDVCPTHEVQTLPCSVLNEPNVAFEPGRRIADRYEVVGLLGQGRWAPSTRRGS